jgi:NAD(P)-dependent dehydrogenase (short-subunit alcohol dehydrogenase family)
MQIKDRVFIVTGASSGIGLSTAIALSDLTKSSTSTCQGRLSRSRL